MNDRVVIRDLRVETRIGVTDNERAHPTKLVIDIELVTDLTTAGTTDDVDDTVDYGRAVTAVAELVRSTEARLLEHLAAKIVGLFADWERVRGVTVEVVKELPPITEDVKAVAVKIERMY